MARNGRNRTWRRAAMAVAWVAASWDAAAQTTAPEDDGAELSATVTVTRELLRDDGSRVRDLPTSRYRLVRWRDGRMHLTMLASQVGPRVGPMYDPYAGISVEGDLGQGAIRVSGADGASLALPGNPPPAWHPPAGSADGFVEPLSPTARRHSLEQRFGRPAGRVRGRLRYVAREGQRVEELLVAADTQLPVELNVVEDGVLREQHAFTYLALAGRGWVRQRSTSQTVVPGPQPQRLRSTTQLDDIRTAGGGR